MISARIERWVAAGIMLAAATNVTLAEDSGVAQGSIRCGRDVVTLGTEAFLLLDKCGDPDFRQLVGYSRQTDFAQITEPPVVIAAADSSSLAIEQWVYYLGKGRLARVLTLTGGVVTDIRLSARQ